MFHNKRNKRAFTLIELLVVVIIVAVLAAVGIPLLTGNVQRARASEAEAALGTIRTAQRAFFAEHSQYATGDPLTAGIGLQGTDLNGRFFDGPAYATMTGNATAFCAQADGAASLAPRHDQVDTAGVDLIRRSINQNGELRDGPCSGVSVTGTCLNCT